MLIWPVFSSLEGMVISLKFKIPSVQQNGCQEFISLNWGKTKLGGHNGRIRARQFGAEEFLHSEEDKSFELSVIEGYGGSVIFIQSRD